MKGGSGEGKTHWLGIIGTTPKLLCLGDRMCVLVLVAGHSIIICYCIHALDNHGRGAAASCSRDRQ